jgi:hypothetical protein
VTRWARRILSDLADAIAGARSPRVKRRHLRLVFACSRASSPFPVFTSEARRSASHFFAYAAT